jgi:hypothetical protein
VRLRKVQFALIDATQEIADIAHDIALGAIDVGASTSRFVAGSDFLELGALIGVSASPEELQALAAVAREVA